MRRATSSSQAFAIALACLVAQLLLLTPHVHGSLRAGTVSYSQEGGSDCLWADLVVGEAASVVVFAPVVTGFSSRTEAPPAGHRTRDCLADAPKQGPP